ncbi:hypothetical protein FNV43_RR22665 [Rhamnella rubrinervis]|uniref:Uncharacterized protein n=1 Tax=Rhamnella rubrinervis TaxID=2594499 RepID=A0A8K0DRY5_9ROSA|nr:hypothetical protein FNV43_RR22665 [Rhamnella rubrinervis]
MRITKAIVRSILTPIRVLNKAKNFYVKNMESCAGRLSHGNGLVRGPSAPVSLSESFSVHSSMAGNDEELSRLLRMVSMKGGSDTHSQLPAARKAATEGYGCGMGMRSYSVGLGKIGRIDEDKPCDFEEDEASIRGDMYIRSTSYAVRGPSMYRR